MLPCIWAGLLGLYRASVTGVVNAAQTTRVDMGDRGAYDTRNKVNDLTGKEWLQLSKSVWVNKRNLLDKGAYEHPAPFLIEDIHKLITLFKKNDRVVDIFMECGTNVLQNLKWQSDGNK